MHDSVMKWVGEKVKEYDLSEKSVLETGCLDVNGTVRPYFTGRYIGTDMREGKGVDRVCNAHELPFDTESFEMVVSTEMFEHDDKFWLSLAEMKRVLKPDGILLLTSRGIMFGEHGFPSDYYRFTPESMKVMFDLADCEVLEITNDPAFPGFFGLGKKRT